MIYNTEHNLAGGHDNFPSDSNDKNFKFLKGFESSTTSLSARSSFKVTYLNIKHGEFSSISVNVFLFEKV